MPLYPIKNDSIGFLRRLPEKAVRLALQYFHLRACNTLRQHFGLRDVIAADGVGFADQDQSRRLHVTEPVRSFEVMTRNTKMDELRQLGMGCPCEPVEFFDAVAVPLAEILGKESVGFHDLVTDKLLKSHFDHIENQPMR